MADRLIVVRKVENWIKKMNCFIVTLLFFMLALVVDRSGCCQTFVF
jgi:hypothetical protein